MITYLLVRSYKMIQYKLCKTPRDTEPSSVTRTDEDGTTWSIPLNVPDNTDYQAYLKWLEEGNTPQEAE